MGRAQLIRDRNRCGNLSSFGRVSAIIGYLSQLIQERKRSIFRRFDAKLDYHRDRGMPPDILLQSIPTDLAEVPGTIFNVGDLALTIETCSTERCLAGARLP